MSTVFNDLRLAVRSLRTRPGFLLTAALTMTLGIGAAQAAAVPERRADRAHQA